MRTKSLLGAAFLLTAASLLASLPNAYAEESQLQALLNRRVEELEKANEMVAYLYKEGKTGYDALREVQSKLLEAKLDAAQTPPQRVEILEKMLDLAKNTVQVAEAKFHRAETTKVDVLLAQAAATEVEIRLCKARVALNGAAE